MTQFVTCTKILTLGYSFGRPVREIGAALQTLAGTKQGEEELYGVFLEGSTLQQYMQRQIFQRCAERWANWWEKHWKEHVSDVHYALVELPGEEPIPVKLFPSGPGVKIGGRSSGHIAVPGGEQTDDGGVVEDGGSVAR